MQHLFGAHIVKLDSTGREGTEDGSKIHCGTMSIDKDKYLTSSQRTRSTRSSHNSQYCRPQTYSDALKFSFFLRDSLAPSVVGAETTTLFK